jgi:maleate isomerase
VAKHESAVPLHAGVLVPWANSVVEAELPRWLPETVVCHYSRLVPASRSTALNTDFLTGLISAVPQALEQLSALQLPVAYLACTSAAFMFSEMLFEIVSAHDGQIVTAFDAIVSTLRRQRLNRIALLTPYPRSIADSEALMFGKAGVTVVEYATLGLDDGYAEIQSEQIRAMASQLNRESVQEAEAIVLSCTGWPTFELEHPLQQQFKMPAISSNRAIAAHAACLSDLLR